MDAAKEEIRKKAFNLRKNLDSLKHRHLSLSLAEKAALFTEKNNLKAVSVFLSYGKEPLTDFLISYLLVSGRKVYVPVADYKRKELFHAPLTDLTYLKKDEKGIRIPEAIDELISPQQLSVDAVFCPGLAFDVFGRRIGHGEGFYDRLLSAVKDSLKIGLCFEFQIFEDLPSMDHDIKMDYLITEKRVIKTLLPGEQYPQE